MWLLNIRRWLAGLRKSGGGDRSGSSRASQTIRARRRSQDRRRRSWESKYLIEFRFNGHVKKKIRNLQKVVFANHGARTRRREVPHITLVGPCKTKNGKRLIRTVLNVAKKYDNVTFRLDGFGMFEGRAVYVKIKPSDELNKMRNEIVETLQGFCQLQDHDHGPYRPHATLCMDTHFPGNTNIRRKFDDIMRFLNTYKIPHIRQCMLRVTILGSKGRIVCEYDLFLRKKLSRREALDRYVFRETMRVLKEKRRGLDSRPRHRADMADEDDYPGRVFVASDLHFDHENIIRFCDRPFRSAREMNRAMLNNWNRAVSDNDRVYYLGDLTYSRGRKPIDFWLSKLNGEIRFIRGNHDTDIITRAEVIQDHRLIRYHGHDFLLMHDPYRPPNYPGWIIHGGKHNNYPRKFPHINRENKTINVCVEWTGYAPMNMDEIVAKISGERL